ncbi:MAG: ABC transporter substrate-binding protein [Gammaproteobacteria bacterium]|nr:MAG: ABC transporter substrate-binding protein [Gammaproteobacteria bacterium]
MKRIFAFVLLLVMLPATAATGPEKLIRDTSEKVIAEIKANQDSYQQNPDTIHRLVDEVVLPHFDFNAMTDLALGRYKDKVSGEQRPTIVMEFRQLLVRTYSSALLEYTDQELIYLPMEGSEADGEVVVRTEIEQAGGFPIPINYSLRLGDDGWKVFDISVDEVSLVTNYRSSFARAIKKDGVDGLIKTLQDRNQE